MAHLTGNLLNNRLAAPQPMPGSMVPSRPRTCLHSAGGSLPQAVLLPCAPIAASQQQQRCSVIAAAKKKPRYQDFDDLDLAAISSLGSMDDLPGSATKYADLIKDANGLVNGGAPANGANASAAPAATAPAKGKQQQSNRPPADFGFDNWGFGGGYSNGGGYNGYAGGGGYNNNANGNGGGYNNGGGYANGGYGGGYTNGYNGGGYVNGGGYGGYMSPPSGGYGSYIQRPGTGGRYDARAPTRGRNGSRIAPGFLDDNIDFFSADATEYDDEKPQVEEVRPDSVVINGRTMQANNGITAREVFLLGAGPERKPLGAMPTTRALELAKEAKEDLLLITPDASPPVARIIKWSKYKYELEKGAKEKKAKSTVVELKEVRLRPTTDVGDVATKVKSCTKFLEKGNKVKLVMKFEGRELQYKEQGKEVLLKFIEELGELAKVEGPLNFKTGTYNVILAPVKA